jgi:ribosomal protein S6
MLVRGVFSWYGSAAISNKKKEMDENTVPAVEAQEEAAEAASYECAFHLLPTVADGEVARVFESLKGLVTVHGGEVFDEEMPQRFTLAYEIRQVFEGRSQHFTNSWFGWMRFTLAPQEIARLEEELKHQGEVLRYLLIKLTREEIEKPKRVFEKKPESATVTSREADADAPAEVSEADLNKSLEQITS